MNDETLQHLAHLSRLSVPEEERQQLVKDIENIVGFIDVIQSVPVSVADQTYTRANIARADEVNQLAAAHDLVEAAPMHRDHFVEVPKVIE